MTTLTEGQNFKIETGGKITLFGYTGYYKEKVLIIIDSDRKRSGVKMDVSIYEKVISMIREDSSQEKGHAINNVLLTPCDAIVLLLRDIKIKFSILRKSIEHSEEAGEPIVRIKNINFGNKILPVIIKDYKKGKGTIATRDVNNNIV